MKQQHLILIAPALLLALFTACQKTESTSTDTTTTSSASATDTTIAATPGDTSGTAGTSSTGNSSTAMTATSSALDPGDSGFARKAAAGGSLEVTLGSLAAVKGNDPAVKDFGSKMVTDHGAAGDELKQLATSKGLTLDTSLSKEGQATDDRLSSLTGKAFDKAYVDDMVKDHEEDAKEFEKAAKDIKDPDLKAWAAKTLVVINDHLKMIKDIKAKMK